MKKIIGILAMVVPWCALAQKAPYFSGATFRDFCDIVLEFPSQTFDPKAVKHGTTIFVKPDRLELFCSRYLPAIKKRFILVSHNSDHAVPGKFKKVLNNPYLVMWFAKNAIIKHPKLVGLPIGMVGPHMFGKWVQGTADDLDDMIQRVHDKTIIKNKLLYANFSTARDRGTERAVVWDLFKDKEYCYKNRSKKPYKAYLQDLAESTFVLSPRGSGWDCYRTWEALIMGSYPIVRRSPIDALYKGLPVVIVDKWADVTPEFLHKKCIEFATKTWNMEKLYAPYWLQLIQKASQGV